MDFHYNTKLYLKLITVCLNSSETDFSDTRNVNSNANSAESRRYPSPGFLPCHSEMAVVEWPGPLMKLSVFYIQKYQEKILVSHDREDPWW